MGVKSAVRHAADVVIKSLSSSSGLPEETDLLDTLKREHDEVKELLSQLRKASTASARKKLVQQIKAALVPHTKAEEKILYHVLIGLRDPGAQENSHEGYLEHEWAAKTLQRLASLDRAVSPEHRAIAKVLTELVEHHIAEEEKNVWKDAEAHFSLEQRRQMNVAYLAARARVKVA